MYNYREELSDEQRQAKIELAANAYAHFMDIILPGWQDDPNSKDTPMRVAKMYINELLMGFYGPEPKITSFPNTDSYSGIVFQGACDVKSMCSHHHAFIFGKAYIAYIPTEQGYIIGLSKLNRIVNYYSRRVQIQENLTEQIHNAVNEIIGENRGVAVVIRATHTCVSHRGVGQDSEMQTARLSGLFFTDQIGTRKEFYSMIANCTK